MASLIVLTGILEALKCSTDDLLFVDLRGKAQNLHVVSQLLTECTGFERNIILKTIRAMKHIVLENRDLRQRSDYRPQLKADRHYRGLPSLRIKYMIV